jgi:hypothetical protein
MLCLHLFVRSLFVASNVGLPAIPPEDDDRAPASFGVPSGVGLYVMATILETCFLSFAITHLL